VKARPRSVERQVAKLVSAYFVGRGWSPVERIPVLGRTGPDISINESGLVIDVKSRLSTPKDIFSLPGDREIQFEDGLLAVRLANIDHLFCPQALKTVQARSYKTIWDWWTHMDEWTRRELPGGVTALVLHRPGDRAKKTRGTLIRHSLVVIHSDQRSVLYGKTAVH
jgi:hypothetical protein